MISEDQLPAPSEKQPTLSERLRDLSAIARRSLTSDRKKRQRLLIKLDAEQAVAQNSDDLRLQGEVLKMHLQAIPRGAESIELQVPWLPEQTVKIALQRDHTPQQNLERLFRRARGFAQGLEIIEQHRQAALQRLQTLAQLQAQWEELFIQAHLHDTQAAEHLRGRDILRQTERWLAAVRALQLSIGEAAKPLPQQQKIVKKAGGQLPAGVQLFQSPLGAPVLAGRSALANDALVTKLLRGRDVWLHVRDSTGAHVVLRAQAAVADAELRACAMLAAHLSGVAKGDRAEVCWTLGKNVRKVKGAPAGSVYVSGEKSVLVLVDAGVIDRFYATRR